ncbi:MAG: 50S ribosomal protein L11 methyltransferase [Eubacteriales bacterium]|nr:50S ribosomal protein L11 methyltransferase [Eubacteriales bacterium]MDD3199623.1 50S ribosomal protein L11 methyltransferase [Eubacteriales bacterium]MDD4629890.1 50S ribosomal protein L11 methyltransferase [Eubacteriales bacterium]
MRYFEIKINTTQDEIDLLTCILMDMGIAGFAIDDARDFRDLLNKKNPHDWDYIDENLYEMENLKTGITFYLEETEEGKRILKKLQEKIEELIKVVPDPENKVDFNQLEMNWQLVDDADWKDKWKEYFKPVKLTERIVVKPTWEAYEAAEDELIIEIDPGMAFGTGTHPTTFLCIQLLEKYIEKGKDTVLDIGCGSGILSITAALLGASAILAVDIDPMAVKVTKDNIKTNHLSSEVRVIEGDLTNGIDVKADIAVANLMADLVISLSEDIPRHLKGKGVYISSGILIEKKEQVVSAIETCGFKILEILEEGEWCAIAAQIKGEI